MELAAAAFAGDPAVALRGRRHRRRLASTTPGACSQRARARSIRSCASCGIARGAASPTRCAPATCNARGDVLVFYPADLQFKPEDIPRLVAPILAGECGHGHRLQGRASTRRRSSRGIYNGLSRALFDVPVKDLNSVKAYRREIMDALPVRPDWHRYMIVIAAAQGFTVTEIPVPLYPRHAGQVEVRHRRASRSACSTCCRSGSSCASARSRCSLFGMLGAGAVRASALLAGLVALGRAASSHGVGIRAGVDDHPDLPHPRQRVLRDRAARRADRRPARRAARAAPPARRAEARATSSLILRPTRHHSGRSRAHLCGSCAGPSCVALVGAALWALRGQLPSVLAVADRVHPRWGLVVDRVARRAPHLLAAHRELASRARRARRRARSGPTRHASGSAPTSRAGCPAPSGSSAP